MGSSDRRDPLCTLPLSLSGCNEHALTAIANARTLLENKLSRERNDGTLGYYRDDVFLNGLDSPITEASFNLFMDEHRLWSLMRVFDGLHLILNHSIVLRSTILDTLTSAQAKSLNTALRTAGGLDLSKELRAGWQWRQIWAQVDVWRVQLAKHARLQRLVLSFSRIIAALYAPARLRDAKRLLQLAADCFAHARIWHALGLPKHLSIHSIFPHLPFVFKDLAPSHALTEASESVFRPLRRIAIYASKHGDDSVRAILLRLLLYLAVRRWRMGLRQKRMLPVAEEPCARCATGLASRTLLEASLLGDLSPFRRMIEKLGFDFRACVTRLADGSLRVHDAHVDPIPSSPALPSLSALSDQRTHALKQLAERHWRAAVPVGAAALGQAHHAAPAVAAAQEREENIGLDDALPDEDFDRMFGTEAEQDFWDEREIADAEHDEARDDEDFKMSSTSARNLAQAPPAASECARARLRTHRASTCPICGGNNRAAEEGAGSGLAMQLGE